MKIDPNERVFSKESLQELPESIEHVVSRTPITDIHTHLFPTPFNELFLWGIDELLTYHYLAAEVIRATTIPMEAFGALSKQEQADLIWRELFVNRTPLSEACRGVVTVLSRLGLDPAAKDLGEIREYFARQDPEEHIENVFRLANLRCAVMTNDPFDAKERPAWEAGFQPNDRFKAALRIDMLINDWASAWPKLRAKGYHVDEAINNQTLLEVRRFITDWMQKTRALYMAVSLPPEFGFPAPTNRAKLIAEAIMPIALEFNIPFAMMIGVKRAVNPALHLAGDGVGKSDISTVEKLCASFPGNKFMVTMLAREDQHALCVAARKFRNLQVFGCWWFLNNPSLIEEMTRMRMELLGQSFIPQHSDARVLEQVIYKWRHSIEIISRVLADKYADLIRAGRNVSEKEIERDVRALLDGNFWTFLGR